MYKSWMIQSSCISFLASAKTFPPVAKASVASAKVKF